MGVFREKINQEQKGIVSSKVIYHVANEAPVFFFVFFFSLIVLNKSTGFHGGMGVSEAGLTEYTQSFTSNAEVQSALETWC